MRGMKRLAEEIIFSIFWWRGSAGVYPGASAIETETLKSPSFSLPSIPNTPIHFTASAHALQPISAHFGDLEIVGGAWSRGVYVNCRVILATAPELSLLCLCL